MINLDLLVIIIALSISLMPNNCNSFSPVEATRVVTFRSFISLSLSFFFVVVEKLPIEV